MAYLEKTRDAESPQHIVRTQHYLRILAEQLQKHPRFSAILTDRQIALMTRLAPLHDIGKIAIPDTILLKPGPLTQEELAIVRQHAPLGGDSLERAARRLGKSEEFATMARDIARGHHEWWNGSGYPDGLKGEDIPVCARLMALADVFDALTSHRVYKSTSSFRQARDIVVAGSGSQFDPDVVNAFVERFDDFVNVGQTFPNVP